MLMMERSADNDIFCGRGKGRWNSPGNLKLKEIVLSYLQDYANAPSKTAKSRVVEAVVARANDRQLRFVKENKNDGEWHEISKAEIRAKVAHCVRDQYQSFCKKNLIKMPKEVLVKKRRRTAAAAASSDGVSASAADRHSNNDENSHDDDDDESGFVGGSSALASLSPETAALLASQQQYLVNQGLQLAPQSATNPHMAAFHPSNQFFQSESSQIGARAMPNRLHQHQNHAQQMAFLSRQHHEDVVGSLAMMRNQAAARAFTNGFPNGNHSNLGAAAANFASANPNHHLQHDFAAAKARGLSDGDALQPDDFNAMFGTPHFRRDSSLTQASLGPALDPHTGNKLLGLGSGAFQSLDNSFGMRVPDMMPSSANNNNTNNNAMDNSISLRQYQYQQQLQQQQQQLQQQQQQQQSMASRLSMFGPSLHDQQQQQEQHHHQQQQQQQHQQSMANMMFNHRGSLYTDDGLGREGWDLVSEAQQQNYRVGLLAGPTIHDIGITNNNNNIATADGAGMIHNTNNMQQQSASSTASSARHDGAIISGEQQQHNVFEPHSVFPPPQSDV